MRNATTGSTFFVSTTNSSPWPTRPSIPQPWRPAVSTRPGSTPTSSPTAARCCAPPATARCRPRSMAGPQGMHPTGASWVSAHHDAIHSASDRQLCAACHGADFRGSVLSRARGSRALSAQFDGGTVTLNLFQGAIVGCYTCHNGPDSDSLNSSAAPGTPCRPPTATNRELFRNGAALMKVRFSAAASSLWRASKVGRTGARPSAGPSPQEGQPVS